MIGRGPLYEQAVASAPDEVSGAARPGVSDHTTAGRAIVPRVNMVLLALDAIEGISPDAVAALREAVAPETIAPSGDGLYRSLYCSFKRDKALQAKPMIVAVRRLADAGRLHLSVAFCLIDALAHVAADPPRGRDPMLVRIRERLTVMEDFKPSWMDDDTFLPNDGFNYFEALTGEIRRRVMVLRVEHLISAGEVEMAQWLREDPNRYEARLDAGVHRLRRVMRRREGAGALAL